jgi:hypothetical protein
MDISSQLFKTNAGSLSSSRNQFFTVPIILSLVEARTSTMSSSRKDNLDNTTLRIESNMEEKRKGIISRRLLIYSGRLWKNSTASSKKNERKI